MSYSTEVLADSPLAYWRLGEASGTTAADSSGNARSASINSSPTLGATGLLIGDADTCFDFPGSGSTAVVATEAAWMQVGTMSIEFWFSPDTVTGTRQIVGRRIGGGSNNTSQSWGLAQGGNLLQLSVHTGSGAPADATSAAASIAIGGVYHVVGTYDGSNVRLYINGTLVATTARSGTMNSGASRDFTIGKNVTNADRQVDGRIDEVSFYSTVLSQARITAHYLAGLTNGVLGATMGPLSAALVASAPSGDLVGTLGPVSADVTGAAEVSGDIAGTLPTLTTDLTGTYGPTGTVSGALPTLESSLAGDFGPTGDLPVTLPSLTADLAGTYGAAGVSGDIAGTLPTLTTDLTGTYGPTGDVTAALPALAADVVGDFGPSAALDIALPAFTTDLAGSLEVDGTLAGALPALVADFDGTAPTADLYETSVLGDSPFFYFRLEEPSGAFLESTGSGVTLTALGTVGQGNPGAFASSDYSVGVSGPTNYLTTNLSDLITSRSIEFWYKGTDGQGIIASTRGSGGSHQGLTVGVGTMPETATGSTGAPYVGVSYGTNKWRGISATGVTIDDDEWHHIVGTLIATSGAAITTSMFKLYVDGVQVATTTGTAGTSINAPLDSNGGFWQFGHGYTSAGADGITGDLDEIAAYSPALTDAQVIDHFAAALIYPIANLAGTLPTLGSDINVFGDPTGYLDIALPALTAAIDGALTFPQPSDTANLRNGRRRTGYFTFTVTNPIAEIPIADNPPIRVVANSVPTPTIVNGRPQ